MEIGVGLDASLGMTWEDQIELSKESARLGYSSIWTPEANGVDSFHLCVQRWLASREVVPGGVVTGISVSPVMYRTPLSFAMGGGTVSQITGGKFIMGIGSGGAYQPRARRVMGLGSLSTMQLMRDYVTVVRGLVSGETIKYKSDNMMYQGLRLGILPPPKTPVYLGALGPQMLGLAGELADGACLNWCTPEQIAWSRERINLGVSKVGRSPSDVKMAEYIRICVDDDEDVARIALAKATMGYALGPNVPTDREKHLGYRGHFARMGFEKELDDLNQKRARGASRDEVAEAFPPNVLNAVGYFGKAAGAAAAFKRLAVGLDISMVRVVAARPNLDSVRAVLEACAPNKIEAA